MPRVELRATNARVEKIRGMMLPILRRHGVRRAALFGSFARDEARKRSDIDLLVEFEGEKSLLDLVSLKLDLQEMLEAEVDVLTYNGLHPTVRRAILAEQVAIL